MARVAFMTMVLLRAPRADPQSAGFMDRIEGAFAQADDSPGFLGRSRVDPATGLYDWGVRGVPSTFPEREPGDRLVHTLSLWRDLESIVHYAYRDLHAEALRARREWMVPSTWPTYLAWWVGDEVTPTWSDGYARFDSIHLHGSTSTAFDFRRPFDAQGHPTQLTRPGSRASPA